MAMFYFLLPSLYSLVTTKIAGPLNNVPAAILEFNLPD